jgi:hypothetical protein
VFNQRADSRLLRGDVNGKLQPARQIHHHVELDGFKTVEQRVEAGDDGVTLGYFVGIHGAPYR